MSNSINKKMKTSKIISCLLMGLMLHDTLVFAQNSKDSASNNNKTSENKKTDIDLKLTENLKNNQTIPEKKCKDLV